MPEGPPAKFHPHPADTQPAAPDPGRHPRAEHPDRSPGPLYAELHCLSNFSFLRGASHPEELVTQAAALGYAALAITDRNSLAGVVRAHVAARDWNRENPDRPLKLIIGAEITPQDGPPLVLLAPDRPAYGRLCRLITRGRLRSKKGACRLTIADVCEFAEGLIAIMQVDDGTEGRGDEGAQQPGPRLRAFVLSSLRPCFQGRLFLAAALDAREPDAVRLARLAALSEETGVPLVATNDVHYHAPERRYLQDVLTCIRDKCTIADAGTRLFANAERHLRPREEIAQRYTGGGRLPNDPRPRFDAHLAAIGQEAIARSVEIADRCTFSLDELRYEYPHELVPPDRTAMDYLEELTWKGAAERCGESHEATIRKLLAAELALIRELRYEHYFLTVWDLCRFARERGILCQGRGSAANSAVCYMLKVTAVDPTKVDLLFERFLSKERNEPPDIDVDFEHERREEVFQYIYEKYGRERAAITAEVITYRPRSAVRDVGKALGFSLPQVDAMARSLDWWSGEPVTDEALHNAGVDPQDRTVRQLIALVRQILGFPRHLSQHVGGFVMTETPLCEIVPLENGAMPGRTFIEWDKDDIDALGILKVDCLALGMLTAIHRAFDLVHDHHGVDLHLHTIPAEDPNVYDAICAADTIGVFQIESRAQMSMLPRLKPRNFYDLVIEVAIVRPGPIQGGMVHPFLKRRDKLEAVTYPSPAVESVLRKTLGVPLFQEQVMRLAVVAAGFTPGEADQLRRAMAAWRRNGEIEKFQVKLIQGMLDRGYTRAFAEQIYRQIQGFGEYGFPESHAASFALLVYASAWLKCYYPAVFTAALINSQPMGFYTPAQLVRDAREHGVEVRPVDVNFSWWDCTLEERDQGKEPGERCRDGVGSTAVRLGMRLVRGLSKEKIHGILETRQLWSAETSIPRSPGPAIPLHSIRQLARRPDVTRAALLRLAAADAFRSLGLSRREAVWQILALDHAETTGKRSAPRPATSGSLFAELELPEPPPPLPAETPDEVVVEDYDATGMCLTAHPIGLLRPELDALGAKPGRQRAEWPQQGQSRMTRGLSIVRNAILKTIPARRRVAVAGLVTCRQHPSTARGTVFITLEDETAAANLIVRPQVWEQNRTAGRSSLALIAEGVVERQGAVVHIMVTRLHDLSSLLGSMRDLRHGSRDFH
jgi:error-prone DNA polymerase